MPKLSLKFNPKSASVIITGLAFTVYAQRYHEAAKTLIKRNDSTRGFDPVPYQLACQSLELYLKAFLWLKLQINYKCAKKQYGHKLDKLWEDAKKNGINKFVKITPLRESTITLVSTYYKDRQFSYLQLDMIASGYTDLKSKPKTITTLLKLTGRLGITLKKPIMRASNPP